MFADTTRKIIRILLVIVLVIRLSNISPLATKLKAAFKAEVVTSAIQRLFINLFKKINSY